MQDGRGRVPTPAAAGAGGAGIPGGERRARGDEPAEDAGGSAEDDGGGVATVPGVTPGEGERAPGSV